MQMGAETTMGITVLTRHSARLSRVGWVLPVLLLVLSGFGEPAAGQPSGELVVRISNVIGFGIKSAEQFPTGLYLVDYDFVAKRGETLLLTAQDEASVPQAIVLEYESGLVVSMEARLDSPDWLEFNLGAEGARWRDPTSRSLPDAATITRLRETIGQVGSIMLERFGLAQFRGQASDEAHLLLQGRALVSVAFESFSYRGSAYTLFRPLTDGMTEVLTLDEFIEEWVISVSARALSAEHRAITPMGSLRMILTWEGGQWRGELQNIHPVGRLSSIRPLSATEAQDLWGRAKGVLTRVRERFHTGESMVPLAQFGSP
jgi:hypothetical protein